MTILLESREGRSDTPRDKWALVLGVSSGLGAASARQLSLDGFDIAGVHRDRSSALDGVTEVKRCVERNGRRVLLFNCNACDAEQRAQVISALAAELEQNSIHVLLHSLSFGVLRPFLGPGAANSDDLAATVRCMGNDVVFWVQDLLGRGMLHSPGRVLALTSEGSQRVLQAYGPVSAAKAALEANMRQLAVELAPSLITANCIRAGVTDTPALRRIPSHERILLGAQARNPHGRLTQPEDVAQAVSLLCDARAQWISGSIINCDGAETMTC
jgi:enoyl-[acyl-carrier protein] reductase III